MCLSTIYYGKRKQKILDSLPNRITGYKQVARFGRITQTYYRSFPIKLNKIMEFETNRIEICAWDTSKKRRIYQGGCHVYLEKPSWIPSNCGFTIKTVFNKKDIQTIGSQNGDRCVTVSKVKFSKK